jgi:hypothetical protein
VGDRESRHDGHIGTPLSSLDKNEPRATKLTYKHATAEAFVSGLKKLSTADHDPSTEATFTDELVSHKDLYSDGATEDSSYDYVSLNYDTSCVLNQPKGKTQRK